MQITFLSKLLFLILFYLNLNIITTQENNEELEIDEDEASRYDDEDDDDVEPEQPEKDVFSKLNVFRIRSEQELGYMTELLDFAVLQFFYVPYSASSKRVAEELIKVNSRIDGLAVIAAINCDEFEPLDFKHCKRNSYSTDSFPRLRLFSPPEKRYDPATKKLKRHYDISYTEKEMKETDIFNFISQNIPNLSISLTNFSMPPFLKSDAMNKAILFTDKHYPGVLFRGLTNNFHDKILFGTVHQNEIELCEKYNITEFPTLMVYQTQSRDHQMFEPEIHMYKYNVYNVAKIIEFLDPFALPEKRYTTAMRGIPEETGEDLAREMELMEIDKENYIRFFEKYGHKKIMVLFHTKNKLKVSVKKYLYESHGYFINVFFNCKGDKDFCLNTFGIKEYPTLRLFDKNTYTSKNSTETVQDWTNFNEFNTATNTTFIGDMNTYLQHTSIYANTTITNFNFNMANSRNMGKYILFSSQNLKYQEVRK
jgi:hypothetical protein